MPRWWRTPSSASWCRSGTRISWRRQSRTPLTASGIATPSWLMLRATAGGAAGRRLWTNLAGSARAPPGKPSLLSRSPTHPWLSRRVVYPLHERLLKRPTFAYLESLEQSQWLSRAALERVQMQKLTALLQTAPRNSPWHAERIGAAGLDIDDGCAPLTLDDLRRLPVMTKQDARANVDRIRWAGVPGGAARYTTGGSSGEPLTFYFGRRRQASDAAGRRP